MKTPKGRKIRVIYNDYFTFGHHGYFNPFFICILKRCRYDRGLLLHELTHADQWFDGKRAFLRTQWDMDARMQTEYEGYRAQMTLGGISKDGAIRLMSSKYKFGLLARIVGKVMGARTKEYSVEECEGLFDE